MDIVVGIIAFILILGVIVLIHEGGHFFFAKRAGILCYEFSIGMGPLLFQKKIGETAYSIRLIPIGGFVSMAGEEVESNPLAGYNYAKLTINERGEVVEIYAVRDFEKKFPKDEHPEDFKKIVSSNLVGTKEELPGELVIVIEENGENVSYNVNREAIIRFSKKEAFQIAPYNRLFVNKSLLNRFLSVFAGPFMNFVLALFVFFIMGLCTGYSDTRNTILGEVLENTPAYEAGLREGDKIISINGSQEFAEWNDLSSVLDKAATGENFTGKIEVVYERDGEQHLAVVDPLVYIQTSYLFFKHDGSNSLELDAFPNNNDKTPSYIAGVRPGDKLVSIECTLKNDKKQESLIYTFKDRADVLNFFTNGEGAKYDSFKLTVERDGALITTDVISSYTKEILEGQNVEVAKVQLGISPTITKRFDKVLLEPFKQVGSSCLVIFRTLGSLFGGGLGIQDLSGPVGIASATVSIVSQGFLSVLNWLAILSVNIGLMNLLPIPALDGGRLVFIAYEAITRKKPSSKVENMIHSIGFLILMALFVLVAFNDVFKLFK